MRDSGGANVPPARDSDAREGSWLDHLVHEAPISELVRLRDRAAFGADAAATTLADRDLGAALRLRALLDQRRQRAAELAALNQIAGQLTTLRAHDVLLREVVAHARRLLSVDLAYLGLVHGDHMVIEVASGSLTSQLLELEVSLAEGLAAGVIAKGEPVWTHDYQSESSFVHDPTADAASRSENIRGLLGVPLQVRGQVLGALFASTRQERHFRKEDVALLSALAAHAAMVIENARSVTQYQSTVARLNAVNDELARRTSELEQTLQWDKTLTQVVLRGGDVDDLVQEISSLAGQPVVFVSQGSPLPGDLALDDDMDRVLAAVATAAPEAGATIELSDRHLVARPVLFAGRHLGSLVLTCAGEPAPDELLLLDRAVPAVALSLIAERAAAEATVLARNALLFDLVTRPSMTSKGMQRQARLAGLDPAGTYCVMVLQIVDDDQPTTTDDDIQLPAGSVIAVHGTRTLIVVPGEDPAGLLDSQRQHARTSRTIGIAGPARGASELAQSYREAQQTVDVLATLGRSGEAATAQGLGIYRILLTYTGRQELAGLVEEQLGPVLREEQRRGVPLLATMDAYLAHGRRHSASASALGIHVNTLYQRLDTLDRLLGDSWREGHRATDLHLVLRLNKSATSLGSDPA